MNIRLHIERLVLDGLNVGPGQGAQVKAAIEAELARLLTEGGLAANLTEGIALPRLSTNGIQLTDNNPTQVGQQIAGAVYGGIGK